MTSLRAGLALAACFLPATLYAQQGLAGRILPDSYRFEPDRIAIPGRRKPVRWPLPASTIYGAGGADLPVPTAYRTGDAYQDYVGRPLAVVSNFLRPLPAGAPLAGSIDRHLVTPAQVPFAGQTRPGNLPGVAQAMQRQPYHQVYPQMQAAVAGAGEGRGAEVHRVFQPGFATTAGMGLARRQSEADIRAGLRQVGADGAVFAASYLPTPASLPNYVGAGVAVLGRALARPPAGGVPAADAVGQ